MPWFVSLFLLAIFIGLVVWLFRAAWNSPPTLSAQRIRQPAPALQDAERILQLVAQGSPLSLRDYLLLFPDACPQCGARTRYEGLVRVPAPVPQPPLTTSSDQVERVWLCPRCGFGTAPTLLDDPHRVERRITSPYLPPDQADLLPEPPYQAPGPDILHVFVLNDMVTPMDFVIHVLEEVFDRPPYLANHMMLDAHYQQERFIVALPAERAEERIATAHQLAAASGHPLRFITRPSIGQDSISEGEHAGLQGQG